MTHSIQRGQESKAPANMQEWAKCCEVGRKLFDNSGLELLNLQSHLNNLSKQASGMVSPSTDLGFRQELHYGRRTPRRVKKCHGWID